MEFPGGTQDENLPANAEDTGLNPAPRIKISCGRVTKPLVNNYWILHA